VLCDQGPRLAEQDGARSGQRDAAGAADQQLNAQLPFKRLDRLRKGGLTQVQLAAGRRHAALFRDGSERPQFANLHCPIASQLG